MADILKITTPLVNKSQALDPKKSVEINNQFDIHNISKVVKSAGQEEILKQNNGMNQESTSAMLLNLLKDPSVTMSSLKNIFLLQELIKLLPINNETFTQEIQQLFNQMLLQPENIVAEMLRQEETSTIFKGEMFDMLRELLAQHPEQKELEAAVVNFLKALNNHSSQKSVLDSVANSLYFLSESLKSSKTLSQELAVLSERFREGDAAQNFEQLKKQVMAVFKEVENSILFSPKLEKVLSMTIYNLSRFNNNVVFFQDSVGQVLSQLRGEQARETFLQYIEEYFTGNGRQDKGSVVMDTLAKLIGQQVSTEELMLMNSEKIEKIIRSLLSSPCNFTPLLHFVVPVQYENIQSFAEMWINLNGADDERDRKSKDGAEQTIHMLLVFDVSGMGKFEMELYVRDKNIDLSLFCPPAYVTEYKQMSSSLSQCLKGLDYRFKEIRIERLERSRSLMEVFRSLPYRRTGVDVKV